MRFRTRDLLITHLPSGTDGVLLADGVCTECTADTLCGGTIACAGCTDCTVCTFCSCKISSASTTCKEAEAVESAATHGATLTASALLALREAMRLAIAAPATGARID